MKLVQFYLIEIKVVRFASGNTSLNACMLTIFPSLCQFLSRSFSRFSYELRLITRKKENGSINARR